MIYSGRPQLKLLFMCCFIAGKKNQHFPLYLLFLWQILLCLYIPLSVIQLYMYIHLITFLYKGKKDHIFKLNFFSRFLPTILIIIYSSLKSVEFYKSIYILQDLPSSLFSLVTSLTFYTS